MLKILILGSEGFVGHNLVEGLKRKHQVRAADQINSSTHGNYTQFNITNLESVMNTVYNVDVVINLVAHTLISSIEDTIKNAQINIIGLLNVLEACRKNNVKKIIFTSASSLIGEPKTFKVDETHVPIPKTAYGITKLTSEHYLRLYNELYGLNYVVFRFFNIYGPHQKNGLISSLYDRLVNRKPVTVFGKGNQIRDYVYVRDIIPFFDKAISTNIGNNHVFNLGTGTGTTILNVIKTLSKIMNVEPTIENKPERQGEIGNFVADTKLLQLKFGDIPKTTLQEGLRNTVSWLNSNYE